MTITKEWDEFLSNLHTEAISIHRSTIEHEYQKQRRQEIDMLLYTNLLDEQKRLVDEILGELGLANERESEVVYQQGLRDSVWLLKHLGVLA